MTHKTTHQLIEARRNGRPALAASCCPPDLSAAYAVQQEVALALGWFADGAPRYWKSGGPSRDAALTHAALPPQGVWSSPAAAGDWAFNFRDIEAEIALRLSCDVDAELAITLDLAQALALIDAMCVSIEIVDSRWIEKLQAPVFAKLADLQSHGALVLGSWVPFAARDWTAQVCRTQIGQQQPVEMRGSHPLADPAFVLAAWLRHATRHGQAVPAGTVVTTGSWVGLLQAAQGDLVTVEFPGIGEASVQL